MEIKTLQPTMGELERILAWAAKSTGINGQRIVPTIQTRGKKARCGGWFAPNRWSTREGVICHEINITAEVLKETPETIVALAVHEIVHLWCYSMGEKDTADSGRHNRVFKEYAEILGLVCAQPSDSYGYGYTTAGPELAERITKECKPDVAVFNLFRTEIEKLGPKPKPPSYKYACGCTEFKSKVEIVATCRKPGCGNDFEVVV